MPPLEEDKKYFKKSGDWYHVWSTGEDVYQYDAQWCTYRFREAFCPNGEPVDML